MDLIEISKNEELLEVGRIAVERVLIDWRNRRLSEAFRGNGLVIREKDGKESNVIRFGPELAIKIGLEAIHEHLQKSNRRRLR